MTAKVKCNEAGDPWKNWISRWTVTAKVKCKCGATVWGKGRCDSDGDGLWGGEIVTVEDLPPNDEWQGGDPAHAHEVDEILETEDDDFGDY